MKKAKIINILEKNPELKNDLFIRGFLITDKKINNLFEFPFYGNWRVKKSSGYYFMAHKLTGMHIYIYPVTEILFLLWDMHIILLQENIRKKKFLNILLKRMEQMSTWNV